MVSLEELLPTKSRLTASNNEIWRENDNTRPTGYHDHGNNVFIIPGKWWNNFLDYNVRNHEQRIHLRIDNSIQILFCVSSAQAGGTE